MKKIRFKLLLSLALLAGIFTACEDEFSEKDALDAQQSIDLSVYVFDGYSNNALEDASVSLIKDGNEKTSETNSLGVATFSKVKIGSNMPVQVKKDGYTSVRKMVNIDNIDYRQSSYSVYVPVLSLDSNTATIKGSLDIQTDLTNTSLEVPPEGTEVLAHVFIESMPMVMAIPLASSTQQPVELTATTDAEGKFEFIVPSKNMSGVYVQIKYPTLTLDQTIAKNQDKGQPEFPETEPSIVNIPTVFNPSGDAEGVPVVPSVYATVPAPSGDGERAVISNVDINNNGEVWDIDFSDNGSGYTADSVDVTVASLFEGSGAEIRIGVSGGSLDDVDARYISVGSGYPTFNNANREGGQSPDFEDNELYELKSGEIRVVYGHYGTGTYREQEIE